MKRIILFLVAVIVCSAPCYAAGVFGELSIEFDAANKVKQCDWLTSDLPAGEADRIQVNFVVNGTPIAPGVAPASAVTLQLLDSAGNRAAPQPTFVVTGNGRVATAPSPGAWADHTIKASPAFGPCEGRMMVSSGAAGSVGIASLASEYFDAERSKTPGSTSPGQPAWQKFTGRRHFDLYLFPGGRAEFVPPKTETLTEEDSVTIRLVAPRNAKVEWKDAITCTPRDFARTLGSPPSVGQLQAAGPSFTATDFTIFTDPGSPRECAQFAWNIKITNNSGEELATVVGELKADSDIIKSYVLSWGAAVGYDFGSPTKFASATRTNSMGMQEMFVDERSDTTGVSPLLTLTAHPCGMVPGQLTWCDRLSPFIGADPTRIDEGFMTGINVMLHSRIGVLLGASFYETEKLSGLQPGATIPEGQTLQTRKTFGSDGIGFFIGVNISDAQTLQGLFSGLFGGN